jgi:hypothetical protein
VSATVTDKAKKVTKKLASSKSPIIAPVDVPAVIDPSTPPFYREILSEQDETTLLNRLSKTHSYPEYVVVMHRLAQLRDTHAVTGILSSSAYNDAKARYDVAALAVTQAEKALKAAQKLKGEKDIEAQIESEREDIRQGVLGFEWKYALALDAAKKDPTYLSISLGFDKEKKKGVADSRSLLKKRTEIDRDLKKAILRKGHSHESVVALRAQLREIDASLAPTEEEKSPTTNALSLMKEQAGVLKTLLGNEKTDGDGQRYFDGSGELDLEPLYAAHLEKYEMDVEMKVMERRIELSHSEHTHLRVAVEQARENLKDVGHDLQVHNAALARAKARSEAARKRIVRFEPQLIDSKFEHHLNERRGQLGAMFVEDSVYQDNFLYSFRTRGEQSTWVCFAEVSVGSDEDKIIKILSAQKGVKKTEQKVAAPDYKSWATLHPTSLITVEKSGGRIHYAPHKSFKLGGKSNVQAGPYSERGILRITGLSPSKALQVIEALGFHKRICETVPYDLIYRGSHRLGRVHPLFEPLASGRKVLRIPDGHMAIHGLTGASGNESLKRLSTIVETGGLASIAERRRLDIQVTSMSPIGDIASGIDMGVPTKIGDSSTWGGTIYFVMKPEILNRRDLWFSDRDFGGGHNRYSEYQAYAKKIGQNHIYDPCPVDSRQNHLDKGLGNTNEAYFRHGISWNEVDTIFVSHGLFDKVVKAVNKWKAEGKLPESLRVDSFGEKSEGTVESSPGEWVIAPDSGELIYLPDVPGKVQTYSSSIDDKIKYRARELARLVE